MQSRSRLERLAISHHTKLLTRLGLASTLLNFGSHLTDLILELGPAWHHSKPGTTDSPASTKSFPPKLKLGSDGRPTHLAIQAVADHTFIVDAALPHLPCLEYLKVDGPLMSTSAFSHFPKTLATVSWSRCPAVQPKALAALLRKTVTRSKTVTNSDGSKSQKTYRTKVATGLKCMTVSRDDMRWTSEDLEAIEGAALERDVCLHLSDGINHNPHPGEGGRGRVPGAAGAAGDGAAGGVGAGGVLVPAINLGGVIVGGGQNGGGNGLFGMGPGPAGLMGGGGGGLQFGFFAGPALAPAPAPPAPVAPPLGPPPPAAAPAPPAPRAPVGAGLGVGGFGNFLFGLAGRAGIGNGRAAAPAPPPAPAPAPVAPPAPAAQPAAAAPAPPGHARTNSGSRPTGFTRGFLARPATTPGPDGQ